MKLSCIACLRMASCSIQVQVAVNTRSGTIQMATASPQQQQSLLFSASVCKTGNTAVVSTTSCLNQPGSAVTAFSKLLQASSKAPMKAASVFGSVCLSSTATQKEQAGVMGIEASLQLANIGKVGLKSQAAAASVGTAATWEALQMCPPKPAEALQDMTVGVQIGSTGQGGSFSDHRLHAGHNSTTMQGVITRPVSALHHSNMGQLHMAQPDAMPQAGPQPASALQSAPSTCNAADMSSSTIRAAGVAAVTSAAPAHHSELPPVSEQAALHSRLLAMDPNERRMFIQAQVRTTPAVLSITKTCHWFPLLIILA